MTEKIYYCVSKKPVSLPCVNFSLLSPHAQAVVKEQHTNSGPEEVEAEMFSPHVAPKTG